MANPLAAKGCYAQYMVTRENLVAGNINGVKIVHLADFWLNGEYGQCVF